MIQLFKIVISFVVAIQLLTYLIGGFLSNNVLVLLNHCIGFLTLIFLGFFFYYNFVISYNKASTTAGKIADFIAILSSGIMFGGFVLYLFRQISPAVDAAANTNMNAATIGAFLSYILIKHDANINKSKHE